MRTSESLVTAFKVALSVLGVMVLVACGTLEEAANSLLPARGEPPAAQDQTPATPDAVVERAPLALAAGLGPARQPELPAKALEVSAPPPVPAAKPTMSLATAAAEPVAATSVIPPPTICPGGTIGMWSQPDVVGSAVYICRALYPNR